MCLRSQTYLTDHNMGISHALCENLVLNMDFSFAKHSDSAQYEQVHVVQSNMHLYLFPRLMPRSHLCPHFAAQKTCQLES